jgi:hypothetical protein
MPAPTNRARGLETVRNVLPVLTLAPSLLPTPVFAVTVRRSQTRSQVVPVLQAVYATRGTMVLPGVLVINARQGIGALEALPSHVLQLTRC